MSLIQYFKHFTPKKNLRIKTEELYLIIDKFQNVTKNVPQKDIYKIPEKDKMYLLLRKAMSTPPPLQSRCFWSAIF